MPVFGGSVVKKRLRVITRNTRRAVRRALDDAADDLLLRARGLAPQLSGELIGRGDIQARRSRDLERRVVFFDSPYAVVRHEDTYNLGPISSLKTSADGTIGRKYLERPFEANQARYQKEIGEAVKGALIRSVR